MKTQIKSALMLVLMIAVYCIGIAEAAKLKKTLKNDAGWVRCADENAKCNIPDGKHRVRFGKNETWKEKVGSGPIDCTDGNFGDPLVGTVKECWYHVFRIGRERDQDWVHCSDENGTCNVPRKTWVRFGKDSTWIYEKEDGNIPCTDGQWGDPKFLTVKECQYLRN